MALAAKSKTETAMLALLALVDRVAGDLSFPRPTRNESAFSVLETFGPEYKGDGGRFNLVDGNSDEPIEELLGEDSDGVEAFEIETKPSLEFFLLIGDDRQRDSTFDVYLMKLHDALRADRTLGGTVGWARAAGIDRTLIYENGLPAIKAATITIALSFTSDRPF